MSRIWTLARKDLLETRRDPLSAVFIVVMPIVFTAFLGLMFANGSDRLSVVVPKTAPELESWIADGRAAAGLLIPQGFSAAVKNGRRAELIVVSDQTSSGAQAVTVEIRAVAGGLVAADRAARVGVETAAKLNSEGDGKPGSEARQTEIAAMAQTLATQAMAQPAVTLRTVRAGAAAGQVPTGFTLSSPGMIVNFIMFSLMTAGMGVIMERRNGTLRRLMTTRMRRDELIAGKMAGMFVLTFFQQALLIGAGQFLFGVDYLNDPVALVLMMIALSLVASSLGLLLAALLSSEQALVAAIVIVSMSVSALSGAWFPLEIAGEGFRAAGHVLPTAWVLDALRDIVTRGAGVGDVLPAFAVALAWAAGLFGVAVARFRLA